MRKSAHHKLRDMLRAQPDGLTAKQMAIPLGMHPVNVRRVLLDMPDTYVDRWIRTGRGFAAVWMVVVPPAHCPHPVKRDKRGPA